MPTYLVQFAQSHDEFRLPEFESLAVIENVPVKIDRESYRLDRPFLKVEIDSDKDAAKLVKRAILIKSIYELWGEGTNLENLIASVKENPERWPEFMGKSFKFTVSAFGSTYSIKQQIDMINAFAFLGFDGDIDMKNPDVQFAIMADFGLERSKYMEMGTFEAYNMYMGKVVASGSRDLVNRYNLKKRKYLGTTSMDAELSLIMANQALATPGKLVYDPFVGTGSFLFTCAHFGSYTLGSDIDGRQIRGKGKASIKSNVAQYDLGDRVLDTLTFDICHNPWRATNWLDAIVTDPPYGVRAGAKKLGRKETSKKQVSLRMYDGQPMHEREDYYPPTKPYEMSEVLVDLLEFAASHLTLGGRLVYWLPTIVDEYSNDDVPQHPCMKLISNSEQNFGAWSRRLITMQKISEVHKGEHASVEVHHHSEYDVTADRVEKQLRIREEAIATAEQGEETKQPGHYAFRDKVCKP
ncbi:hypothetical protein INT43_005868, partial [Umbelopsis isabellina]